MRGFLDGALMNIGARHHLWRSWGFCPRHTWAFANYDIEIRSLRPFSVGILYEDLTGRAARLLASRRPPASILGELRSHDTCYTCDHLEIADGFGEKQSVALRQRANRREATRRFLADSRPVWERRSCPVCLGGDGPPCRPHLLAGAAPPDPATADYLAGLTDRLEAMLKSFRCNGPEASPEARASWVEALGWFGGWEYPLRALDEAPSG